MHLILVSKHKIRRELEGVVILLLLSILEDSKSLRQEAVGVELKIQVEFIEMKIQVPQ